MTKNLNNECFEQIEIDEPHEDIYEAYYHEKAMKDDHKENAICFVCDNEPKEIHRDNNKGLFWCHACGTVTILEKGNKEVSRLIPEITSKNNEIWADM